MTGYQNWIGHRTEQSEPVTDRLVTHFRALLGDLTGPLPLPLGLHWCLMPDVAAQADLGRDGHPRLGLFLPDLGLPRRMWAGGEVRFDAPLTVGDTVTRASTLTDIAFKSGGSGRLGFVTLTHDWSVGGGIRIIERQDVVYREAPKAGVVAVTAPAEAWLADRSWTITPDPTLLFRYSALTFNGHRIHYDHPYATGTEGYAGLVVHGPLQAIWMMNFAADMLGRAPARFTYRGVSPLICGGAVVIEARTGGADIALRVRNADGAVTMQATATP